MLKNVTITLDLMSEWNPPDVTIGMIERAWHWTDQAHVSFWDGLIVAAAERITIVNPFETSPPSQ